MSYTTGTANDMAAVRQALIDACVAGGWTWDSGASVLSKSGAHIRVFITGSDLLISGRTSLSAGDMPFPRRIGPGVTSMSQAPAFSWPCQYRIFVFGQEVYCILQYAVVMFQWLAFGKSTIAGLPGTGVWAEGTAAGGSTQWAGADLSLTGGRRYGAQICPAPFWCTGGDSSYRNYNDVIHSDLDGDGWALAPSNSNSYPGINAAAPLLTTQPNVWNSEAVLLPIRAYKFRPSSKVSLVADLEHARYVRNDLYEDAQVISLGGDRWMVFPFLRKNASQRNGGNNIHHSGTFGWAIRYEGP